MEHGTVTVTHFLFYQTSSYKAVCRCGHMEWGNTETSAIQRIDDHAEAARRGHEHSARA